MIEVNLTLTGDLVKKLNLLDVGVRGAVIDEMQNTGQFMIDKMHAKTRDYMWYPPVTSGNLDMSIGYVTAQGVGSGTAGLANFNQIRHSSAKRFQLHEGGSRKRYYIENFKPPSPPTNPYTIIVFCLAPYAAWQEFGTSLNSANPFFYAAVEWGWRKVEIRLQNRIFGKVAAISKSKPTITPTPTKTYDIMGGGDFKFGGDDVI